MTNASPVNPLRAQDVRDNPDLRDLVEVAQLAAVELVSMGASRAHESNTSAALVTPPELEVSIAINTLYPTTPQSGGSAFICSAQCHWRAKDEEAEVASCVVQYRVTYVFPGRTDALSKEQQVAFANHVALHTAWPFLRAKVQQLSVELGLPAFALPLRKMLADGGDGDGSNP